MIPVRFTLGYSCDPTQEQLDFLRPYIRKGEWPETIEGLSKVRFNTFEIMDVSYLIRSKLSGVELRSDDLGLSTWDYVVGKLEQLDQKLSALQLPMNEKCSITVPNLGLLLIDEVQVCEDECTDNLQHKLDKGWSILAICPQPDQRRPDYILGRRQVDA